MTSICLRAWALWRMTQPTEFLAAKGGRRVEWAREVSELKLLLNAHGKAPNPEAAAVLKAWAPQVLTS